MKKFISTMSILTIVIFTNSCRSQEEDMETKTFSRQQTTNNFKKTGDSIVTDSTYTIANPTPSDPPPKNGHQW